VCWAGDSRAYVYRAGALIQLTRDHTAAAEAAADSDDPLVHLTPVDGITRAVGGDDEFELDYTSDQILEGDRFLLCSDGLYTALPEKGLLDCLQYATPEEASRALIDAARKADARDNITAVVVDIIAAQRAGLQQPGDLTPPLRA
jgi:protein phosphatase